VFEHLRLDEIPRRYILKRYSKNVVTDLVFNCRDYKMTAQDGTSLEYRQTMLFNEAMKTVNRGCSSDHMFDVALRAFKEVNSRMDEEGIQTNTENEHQTEAEYPEGSAASDEVPTTERSEDVPAKETANMYAHIQPPQVAKTKGSRNKNKNEAPAPASAPATACPEPELDANGHSKGQRLCSNCNKIAGHNARTCKKRQMAKQLLEAHQKVYGTSSPTEKVKICIKNLLAKQSVGMEDTEQVLDTDEDEDYEDQTDEGESEDDVEEEEESEDDHGGEGEEEEECQIEETNEQT
jgi:hypothetical protein